MGHHGRSTGDKTGPGGNVMGDAVQTPPCGHFGGMAGTALDEQPGPH